jgi:DNA repair protein RadC
MDSAMTTRGMGMTTLYVRDEDGFQEAPAREVLLGAQELLDEQFRSRLCVMGDADSIRLYLKVRLGRLDHEVFAVLFLDGRRRLLEYVELFRGTLDIAAVYPREVVKEALKRNAAAVIFAHNHPSGVAEPSNHDEAITLRLKTALGHVGVQVIDHMIVGESSIVSFVERRLL